MINAIDEKVSLDQLLLDPNNYRLVDEKEERVIPDADIEGLQLHTLKLLEKQRLGELKDSIRNNGFLEMERLVVRLLKTKENIEEKNRNKKKYVVVEGNRRTAALRSLIHSDGIIDVKLKEKISDLNVVFIQGTDKEIRTYSATLMGIRHVSGPKKWDGFQSAKLINDLHNDGHSFTEIGEILGITNREVGRRFRGYQAFMQMRNDETYKSKVEPRHYALLLEFLAASGHSRKWLNWNDETYRFENDKNLDRVYRAITSDENGEQEIRNPADARKFVSLLGTSYVQDIENGQNIHEMPDPVEDKKVGAVIKRIKNFTNFLQKKDFNEQEVQALADLLEVIQNKVGE